MLRKIGFILCMGLGILCAGYSGYSLMFRDKVPDYVEVADCNIHPENEGKYVLMRGKPTFSGAVEDPEFGVKVKTPALKRVVEMYQYFNSGTPQRPSMSKGWRSKHQMSFEDITGHRYSNPTFPFQSEDFGGELSFNNGNLKIDKEYATKFTYSKYVEFKDSYTHQLVPVKLHPTDKLPDKFVLKGDYFFRPGTSVRNISGPLVGDIRISYKGLLADKLPECTIIAKQVNGVLTKADKSIFVDRVLTSDEIKKQYRTNSRSAAMGALLCGAILLGIGMYIRE